MINLYSLFSQLIIHIFTSMLYHSDILNRSVLWFDWIFKCDIFLQAGITNAPSRVVSSMREINIQQRLKDIKLPDLPSIGNLRFWIVSLFEHPKLIPFYHHYLLDIIQTTLIRMWIFPVNISHVNISVI